MPSVEMRKNTRVFGARVLRSGRRLWPVKEAKHRRVGVAVNGEDWIELFDNSVGDDDQGNCKENGWHEEVGLSQEAAEEKITDEMDMGESRTSESRVEMCAVHSGIKDSRRWGAVYLRKRKQEESERSDFELSRSVDRRYGITFSRKQTKKRIRLETSPEPGELKLEFGGQHLSLGLLTSWSMAAFVESSSTSKSVFSHFLNLILRYIRRSRVRVQQLSSFLLSEPIVHVYSAHGIQFLQDSTHIKKSGLLKIGEGRDYIPLFVVDFSAIPISFMYLHSSLLLRSAVMLHILVIHETDMESSHDKTIDEEHPLGISCESDQSSSQIAAVASVKALRRKLETFSGPKFTSRTLPLRSGVVTRSMQQRSSVRSRIRRNPSGFGMRKANGALAIDASQGGVPFLPKKPKAEILGSLRRSSRTNLQDLNSSAVGLTQDIESASCSGNILVIDSDRCYREEGASITLEFSESKQWFLVVKRNGIRRFMLKAEKIMRPCCVNRVTLAIIWVCEDSWKLEFPNRQDWNIFKELYKKCSERSVQVIPVPLIPVPGVREVLGYADCETVPFRLPHSYITLKGDEVSRALGKSIPIYDMDSDDDEWLNHFNSESYIESEPGKRISEDLFEIIIDAFERGIFSCRDDYTEVEAVADRCSTLAAREVLRAVYSYWMSKRRKRKTALVRMFEVYEPRKAEVIPKAIFRKKRSFKRQPSQVGRGKQLPFLKAMANEREAVEAQNAAIKVQEANDAARNSERVAVLKRQRAQLLMEAADLATYRACAALRIAEAAAGAAKSLDASGTYQFFLSE